MGRVAGIKTINEQKAVVTLELTPKELIWLKGNIENMHIFSENNLEYETKLVQRGKRESSKYFLMPKDLRENLIINSKVRCNKIQTKTKDIYIFAMDKLQANRTLSSHLK